MIPRQEVRFDSGGDECAGWLYRPDEEIAEAPCVVMAHGFSFTRHDGLDLYARPLAGAGLTVLAFDYRHFGDSGGEPRQRFRKAEQLADWKRAVEYARGLDGVDGSRPVLWGYSFGGGHVATIAPSIPGLAAAIVLCPYLNGLRRASKVPPGVSAWIVPRALADLAGRRVTVSVTGPEGSRAAMSFAGEAEGFARAVAPDSPWRNEITPGPFATIPFYRPLRNAGRIVAPIWVGRGTRDITVDGPSIGRFAERAPNAELHDFDADHFDPFTEPLAGEIAASQVEFLRRYGLART